MKKLMESTNCIVIAALLALLLCLNACSDNLDVSENGTTAAEPENTCMLTVRCDVLLVNPDELDEDKKSLVPTDGLLLSVPDAEIGDDDTPFSVLLREVQKRGMHIEYSGTKSSAYIEGIGNIYEFDAGALSGWVYKVNGVGTNVGCGAYSLKPGDKVEFIYTLDLGVDAGIDYEE